MSNTDMKEELLKLMELQGQSFLLGKKAFDSMGTDRLIALYDLLQLQQKVVEGLGKLLELEKELSAKVESLTDQVEDYSFLNDMRYLNEKE